MTETYFQEMSHLRLSEDYSTHLIAGIPSIGRTQEQWKRKFPSSYQRHRLPKSVKDISGTRVWTNAYELSHDLHAKQMEILEKKYGGSWRSRHAATIIQRAYRHYSLNKNFAKLRWEADEKRLSRRFIVFSHSHTVWSDLAVTIQKEETEHLSEDLVYSEFDVMAHSYSTDNMLHNFFSQKLSSRSYCSEQHALQTNSSMRTKTEGSMVNKKKDSTLMNNLVSGCHNLRLDLEHIEEQIETNERDSTLKAQSQNGSSSINGTIGGNHFPMELSDSCESLQNTLVRETSIDLPSACFENLLEKQETASIDDSFSSNDDDDDISNSDTLTSINESSLSNSGHQLSTPQLKDFKDDIRLKISNCTTSSSNVSSVTVTDNGDDLVKYRKKPPSVAQPLQKEGCITAEIDQQPSVESSPIWKRKSRTIDGYVLPDDTIKIMNNIMENGETSEGAVEEISIYTNRFSGIEVEVEGVIELKNELLTSMKQINDSLPTVCLVQPEVSDRCRKRAYRIGLNLFNKKPENGIHYLFERGFLDNRPNSVAKFLIARKGLSKQMIGEYLGILQKPFNMEVLRCFADQIELNGLQIDVALRKFQSYFRMPGEAQKIERLMEAFATRYCHCNPEDVEGFHSSDTVFLLAFAIIMLNTDLHNNSIKPERKMKISDFIRNLRGIDGRQDVDPDLLIGIYERIRLCEFKPGADHVSHVFKLEQMIFGNKPQLSLPHRRLVCYCRMYEVFDPMKRDKVGQHQRELFLFNDILMVTKLFTKKKKTVMYSFRQLFSLFNMVVHIFESPYYKHGLSLSSNLNDKVLIMLNARNEHDRTKFVEDLKESIVELSEMEGMRIDEELKKQKLCPVSMNFNRFSKDSGVHVDAEMSKLAESQVYRLSAPECERLKKSTLCNSLIDITAENNRRGSGASLDSGVVSTIASAESGSVGSSQETNRMSRFIAFSPSNSDAAGAKIKKDPKISS